MANAKLRALRRTAHYYFNQLYKTGAMSKQAAYQWLAYVICAPLSQAHIGYLGEYYCQQVVEKSRQLLEDKNSNKFKSFGYSKEATG